MEDFFKNKLNDLDNSTDSWDKPDAVVWEQAKQQIVLPKKPGYAAWKILAVAVGAFVILILGGYTWWQNREIKSLKTTLDFKNKKIKQEKFNNAELEEKYEEEKLNILAENKNVKTEKELIVEQKINLEKIIEGQQQTIVELKQENQTNKNYIPQIHFEENPKIDFLSIKKIENQIIKESLTEQKKIELSIAEKIDIFPQKSLVVAPPNLPEVITSKQITPVKNKRGEFEIGYELGFINLKMPTAEKTGDKDEAWYSKGNSLALSPSQGVSIAYSPKRNLFIRTGFRTANATIEHDWKYVGGYDKSKEYEKPNGELANNLTLNFSTPYSDHRSNIGLDIPADVALKDDDLLVLEINDFQEFSYYQIPLGLEYFFGKNKWQVQLQSGAQWNKMVFGAYSIDIKTANVKDEKLTASKTEVDEKSNNSKQFYSAYAGLGLDYNFTRQWHVRAAFTYDFNFIKIKSKEFSNSQLIGKSFSLGLNYRF